LLGLYPATGKVVWTRPSTAASHDSGVEQHLVTDGDTVFNVEPAGANTRVAFPAQAAGALDVVAVDARTGKDIWRHPFADVITPLDKCTDAALCVWQDADGGHLDLTRLDLSTGETASEGTAAFDPLVAEDGEFAISASGDTIELTSGFGQQVVWQHPLSEMFAPNDVTPETGWAGLHVGGVWIIWLGGADDSDGATTGIADDGTRLWTRPTRACALIPDTFDAPVMCGHLDNNLGQFVTGTVERLDPQTGTSLWTFDGGGLDLLQPDNNVVRFDATRFGFHLSSGDVGLDYASGPTGPLLSGDGWCPLFADFAIVENSNSILATSWAPCTLAVGPDDTPPTSVPAFAGPTVDGFGAWVEDGEVRAVRVS
jgi:outer membrane protein assembly factor BamB